MMMGSHLKHDAERQATELGPLWQKCGHLLIVTSLRQMLPQQNALQLAQVTSPRRGLALSSRARVRKLEDC